MTTRAQDKVRAAAWRNCDLWLDDSSRFPDALNSSQGDHFVLSGAKNWITNSPIADVCLVAALDGALVVIVCGRLLLSSEGLGKD